ncbi:MAG: AtpZ/AtpI family protein [Microscillaceae bacterium]|nr:AtpZ/AtpI family protein [Microscillaceae bacterium]MDW8461137.1 AtpZ/AtpI family protein [Cytophagales bacterium]
MSKQVSNPYLRYSALGFQMAATIGVFVWIGISLDRWLNLSFPIFVLVFSLIGVIGTMISLINELNKPTKQNNKPEKSKKID